MLKPTLGARIPALCLILMNAAAAVLSAQEATFHSFNGVNYQPALDLSQQMGIGWVRWGMPWYTLEGKPGQWNWALSDARVKNAQSIGAQVLPMLGYTPDWEATIPGTKGTSPPKRVQDWQNYVEQAVSHYSGQPFNLRYFQIWNEPTVKAGFWHGTNQQFVDQIYLPAAKIIRRHGCYVVFGGWPVSNSIDELDSVLNYHNAWQWTDFVDVHYRGIYDWQRLTHEWVSSRKCRGLWQSEIGGTTFPDYITSVYSQLLYASLQDGWKNPDQFRLFWYPAWGAGPEGERSLTKNGPGGQPVLAGPGMNLAAMNQVLGSGPLSLFTQFSTTPALSPALTGGSGARGFKVGNNRVVILFLLDRRTFQRAATIPATISLPGKPSRVQWISASGKSSDLQGQYSGGRLQVNLPLRNGVDECPQCGTVDAYLVVDQ